ncbi:hypothetical protein ACD578_10620 [Microvirga sp. RSM25]|jgi:DNA (cytosine-5)-methyltransferase 1|uniref:hypothetical protein n=1 Tax=Microvirga sp. RSM25 TaxID=3273802 RepID=UPI00384AFD3C
MGFEAEWGVISAAAVGAPHLRERIWLVAHSNSERLEGQHGRRLQVRDAGGVGRYEGWAGIDRKSLPTPYALRAGHGLANWMDRIRATGNVQVPQVAATAFSILAAKADESGRLK